MCVFVFVFVCTQEMMKDRSCGPFENYGEMLYAEGLEAAAARKAKVRNIHYSITAPFLVTCSVPLHPI